MASEIGEATTARIPFIDEEVGIFSVEFVLLVVSLIFGMTVWNMTDSIGNYFASLLNGKLGDVLGFNLATGSQNSGPEGV